MSMPMQPTSLRLPADLKRELRVWAAINERSLSDEMIFRLAKSLAFEKRSDAVRKMAAGDEIGVQPPAAATDQNISQEAI